MLALAASPPAPDDSSGSHQPRLTLQSPRILVYDDFLPEAEFAALRAQVSRDEYHHVHERRVEKSWRATEGNPMRTGEVLWCAHPRTAGGLDVTYPTGKPLDRMFEQILASLPRSHELVGQPRADWKALSAAAWAYPAGCALAQHWDGRQYTGAYTFFVHKRWKLHWGGLLIVLDDDDSVRPPLLETHEWLDDDEHSERMLRTGTGVCIFPRPNRMVFIGARTPHMVTRVDPNAGDHTRLSITGFFQREFTPARLGEQSRLARVKAPQGAVFEARACSGDKCELALHRSVGTEVLVRLDACAEPVLRFIAGHAEFFARELPWPQSMSDRLRLCEELIRIGVLRPS